MINNAGIAHVGNIENTTGEDLDRLYDVNVKGVYNCIQAVIGEMKSKGGVILNMASIASTVGIFDRFAYSMTKRSCINDDLFNCQRLSEIWYSLQLYFTSKNSYPFC